MDITTVKDLGDEYFVNDSKYVSKDDSTNSLYNKVKKWLDIEGNDLEDMTTENLLNAQEVKKTEINEQRDVALFADLTITLADTHSVTVQVSKDTFFMLQALIDADITMDWILENNDIHEFVTADFITFRNALIARNDEFHQARKRKDAVLALTTIEAVKAYDIKKLI